MFNRIKHLWKNTKLGFFQTLIVSIAVIGFSCIPPFYNPQYGVFTVAGLIGLLHPYFFREFMIENNVAKRILHYAGISIALTVGIFSETIKTSGIFIHAGLMFLVASYISCYFWLLSDDRIILNKE